MRDFVQKSDTRVVLGEPERNVEPVKRDGTLVLGESEWDVERVKSDGTLVLWDRVVRNEEGAEIDVVVVLARMVVVVVVVFRCYLDLQLNLLVLKTSEDILFYY